MAESEDDDAPSAHGMRVWHHVPPGRVLLEAGKSAEHWILSFLNEFSELQNEMRFAVQAPLKVRSSRLAGKIRKNDVNHLHSDELWSYMKALAHDLACHGALSDASQAFHRVNTTRNYVAHSAQLRPVCEPGSDHYIYQVVTSSKDGPKIPNPLTPAAFRQLGAECRWLQALVRHFASLAGGRYVGAGSTRRDGSVYFPNVHHLEPPPLPVGPDWDEAGELQRYEYEADD